MLSRPAWILLIALLAIGAGALWWWLDAAAAGRVVRLPDGRVATLVAVTYGTEHRYVHGKPLVKVAARFRSARWAALHGLQERQFTTPAPTVTFWVEWRNLALTNQPPTSASIAGEQGPETEPAWLRTAIHAATGESVVAWNFGNYPRRARTLRLGIFQWQGTGWPLRVAEFRADNPGPRRYAVWTAPPSPVTERAGGWDFSLEKFTTGEPVPARLKPARGYVTPWNTATFRASQNGQPSRAWRVAAIEGTDATGNRCVPQATAFEARGDEAVFGFNGVVWPGEAALKLKVEFSRRDEFAPGELWFARTVIVPPAVGGLTRVEPQTNGPGGRVMGLELRRTGPNVFGARGATWRNGEVNLEVTPPSDARVTLHRATDDRGRTVPHESQARITNTVHRFALELAPDARSVDFTFAVHPSVFAEFLARPELFETNAAPSR